MKKRPPASKTLPAHSSRVPNEPSQASLDSHSAFDLMSVMLSVRRRPSGEYLAAVRAMLKAVALGIGRAADPVALSRRAMMTFMFFMFGLRESGAVGEAARSRSTSSPKSRARAPVAFGGGSEARARRRRCVSRVLAGTRGRMRVRGLLRTFSRPQRRLSAPSMRSTPSAPPPEARGGRWTLRGPGDAIQPLKRRESALKAGAGARETVMPRRGDERLLKPRAADLAGGR